MKILGHSLLVLTVCLLWFSVPALTQTTMTTIINSKFSAPIELIPVDAAHQSALPASLVPLQDRIPPGSVLLVNNSSKPIITVVSDWSFTASAANADHHRLNCDGFLDSPPQEIVHAHSMTLITSNGCTSENLFPQLASAGLLGSSLDSPKKQAPTRAAIDQIHVAVDLVIFNDGQMLGENQHEYHRVIEERYDVVKSIVDQVSQERSPDDMKARIALLRNQTKGHDGRSNASRYWLSVLDRSPNVEGTVRQLQSFPAPPRFHR